MTYQEAMDFLEDTKKYGSILGLDSIRNLMNELGNVQEALPVIHIAGTNGKGSVSAFLSSIYRQAGYHVGRFATPDVFCYEEEFLYDDEPICQEALAEIFKVVRNGCQRMVLKGLPHPTRFEVETAAAFYWFSVKNPDVCIVEVGMGGETDATNIIEKPLVSVLTSISRDHVGFLGQSFAEIAADKSGIIKPGCPVVSTWQVPEVEAVIRAKADACRSALVFSQQGTANTYQLSLRGTFQYQNAGLALDVVKCLQNIFPVKEIDIRKGLASTKWPGRFELIGRSPDFYIDGAHNVDAAKNLRESIDCYLNGESTVFIMGVLEDKDYEDIAEIMFREGDVVYCVTPKNPRALEAWELVETLTELNLGIRAYEMASVKQAVECALEYADMIDGTVVAFGSLSYLKEVKDACNNITGSVSDEENDNQTDDLNRFWKVICLDYPEEC